MSVGDPVTIGVDGGQSCGVAVLRGDELLRVWQGPRAHLHAVLGEALRFAILAGDGVRPHIGCERFTQRTDRGNARTTQTDAQQAVGQVQTIAESYGCPVTLQTPSAVKTFARNDLLRRLGLYVSAADHGWPDADDANDAVRHAVAILGRYHATTLDRLLVGIDR